MSNTLVDVFDETIAMFFTRMYIYIYTHGASMYLLEDIVTHKHLSVIVGRLIFSLLITWNLAQAN